MYRSLAASRELGNEVPYRSPKRVYIGLLFPDSLLTNSKKPEPQREVGFRAWESDGFKKSHATDLTPSIVFSPQSKNLLELFELRSSKT